MALLNVFGVALVTAVLMMCVVFICAWRLRRYDLVDTAWGLTFVAIAVVTFMMFASPQPSVLQMLVTGAVMLWGSRLSWHIGRRFMRSTRVDPRYEALQQRWQGSPALNAFVRIYLLQAVLATAVSAPVIIINSNGGDLLPAGVIGLVVWSIGFAIEAVADRQLAMHIRGGRGGLMNRGLWRYSRHPNYFGEILLWWGLGIASLATPFGVIGLIGPVVITVLITMVSGVPPSERRMARFDDWPDYARRTSVLMPWPPHK